MSDDSREDPPDDPTDLRFVGPATATSLDAAGIDAGGILRKQVSYRQLVGAGINAGVATKIRREHSLPWSLSGTSGDDLGRRSDQVRGLQDDERAWVAASSGDWESKDTGGSDDAGATETGDWEPTGVTTEADGSGEAEAAEAAWRKRSSPDPVTDVPGVTDGDAERLANAGITSVRSLATSNPETVADVLGLDAETVEQWRAAASERS
jgi:predicted flap endonuclease-1-like 5' DNA nuclease